MWSSFFLSNTNNLYTDVWFQIFQSKTKNDMVSHYKDLVAYSYMILSND